MAQPLQFGDSKRPLYGVYHAPAGRAGRRAVLLCNPFGEEAVRAFRIYRLLAEKLADAGAAALRFDYHGTGDSSGACEEASLSGFVESIFEAEVELRDMSGASDIALIGLRLGAAAAALAAGRLAMRPALAILWDPVVSGADYLKELNAGHAAAIKAQLGAAPASADGEALGFVLSDRMAGELSQLNLLDVKSAARRTAIIAGADTDRRVADAFAAAGGEVLWRDDFGETSWNSDRALNSFVVPTRALVQIVKDALA